MENIPCNNPSCRADSHPGGTYIDLFGLEREVPLHAPDRDYGVNPPQFRMGPIGGTLPNIDIEHCGIGNTLKHYIGHEEVLDATIEYRADDSAVWLDADDPGNPPWREQPHLTREQVRDLIRERPDLADVPYAEPLVFVAADDCRNDFWGRAVAAGWAPTQQDLELLVEACSRLAPASQTGRDSA